MKNVDLAGELRKLTPGTPARVAPIVIGNTGLVRGDAKGNLEKLGLDINLRSLQKTDTIQTVKIPNMHKSKRPSMRGPRWGIKNKKTEMREKRGKM